MLLRKRLPIVNGIKILYAIERVNNKNIVKMNSTSKFIVSILGAAAAGAMIGMLLAPEKGSDLRTKIQSAASDWADQLMDIVNSSREKVGEMKGELKARAENGMAEVRDNL